MTESGRVPSRKANHVCECGRRVRLRQDGTIPLHSPITGWRETPICPLVRTTPRQVCSHEWVLRHTAGIPGWQCLDCDETSTQDPKERVQSPCPCSERTLWDQSGQVIWSAADTGKHCGNVGSIWTTMRGEVKQGGWCEDCITKVCQWCRHD